MDDDHRDETMYLAVVNHEEQYSLWPAARPLPDGWTETMRGSRESCLAHIEKVWTDMRPLSLRRAMDGTGGAGP